MSKYELAYDISETSKSRKTMKYSVRQNFEALDRKEASKIAKEIIESLKNKRTSVSITELSQLL